MREALGAKPITSEAEFVQANSYPKGVRDTLRDMVSYLRAASPSYTSSWRLEQENEVYTLDRKALIAGDVAQSAKLKLADPAVHPLLRVAALFDDLEAWHTSA